MTTSAFKPNTGLTTSALLPKTNFADLWTRIVYISRAELARWTRAGPSLELPISPHSRATRRRNPSRSFRKLGSEPSSGYPGRKGIGLEGWPDGSVGLGAAG